jgi:hypothetical protein
LTDSPQIPSTTEYQDVDQGEDVDQPEEDDYSDEMMI